MYMYVYIYIYPQLIIVMTMTKHNSPWRYQHHYIIHYMNMRLSCANMIWIFYDILQPTSFDKLMGI